MKLNTQQRNCMSAILRTFYKLARQYNDCRETRPSDNKRGFNGAQINNLEQVACCIRTLCKEIFRNKAQGGILKVTRTFIAADIARSCPTVDAYLQKLLALGFIKKIETGLHRFGKGKHINCLYITLNMALFEVGEALEVASAVLAEVSAQIAEDGKRWFLRLFEGHNKEIYLTSSIP